jgi:hypothetical protein
LITYLVASFCVANYFSFYVPAPQPLTKLVWEGGRIYDPTTKAEVELDELQRSDLVAVCDFIEEHKVRLLQMRLILCFDFHN